MRSWRKWGVFLAGLVCAAIAQASDPKPVEDKDVFEKQYIECIMSGVRNNCMASLIGERLSPEVKSAADVEEKISEFDVKLRDLVKSNNGIYDIYTIEKTVKATIYDNRIYLIEFGNRSLIGLRIVFRRMHGKWYVETVRVSLDRQVISRFLGLLQSNGDDL